MPYLQVELTPRQSEVLDQMSNFIHGSSAGQLFRVGGYAGTGKTTLLRELNQRFDRLAFCAYTGKAAHVLRQKGVGDASTIHRTIYSWNDDNEKFELKPGLSANCIVVDEASMIGAEIFEDLKSFGKPILAVGDPGQLEPVGNSEINLMSSADEVLETVHRQALGNPVVDLATRIRLHQDWIEHNCVRPPSAARESIGWADKFICGFNDTRHSLNRLCRRDRFHDLSQPIQEGEHLICLRNDRKLGVFNGMTMEVVEKPRRKGDFYECRLEIDDDTVRRLPVWVGALGRKPPDWRDSKFLRGNYVVADYGYAITSHKSQGSEWDKVAVISQQCDLWDPARWLYTAVTRASQEVRLYA